MAFVRRNRSIGVHGLLVLLITACGNGDADRSQESENVPRAGVDERPGIRFDPAITREGDTVGVLVVDSIDARPNIVDSTRVGMARFRGRVELSGHVIEHFDEAVRGTSVCFEADSASAARLPRWLHDERRAWFCFTNPERAGKSLGRAGAPATIVIDSFTIHRGLSDQVNAAHYRGSRDQER